MILSKYRLRFAFRILGFERRKLFVINLLLFLGISYLVFEFNAETSSDSPFSFVGVFVAFLIFWGIVSYGKYRRKIVSRLVAEVDKDRQIDPVESMSHFLGLCLILVTISV